VHGPLIATLLLDLVRREAPESVVAAFRFRAVSPLFDLEPFSVCGQPSEDGASVRLWAKSLSGAMAMDAEATLSLR
jgi:3-methylfumaryl-CoA hydratase